jgi:hypothetical protein
MGVNELVEWFLFWVGQGFGDFILFDALIA